MKTFHITSWTILSSKVKCGPPLRGFAFETAESNLKSPALKIIQINCGRRRIYEFVFILRKADCRRRWRGLWLFVSRFHICGCHWMPYFAIEYGNNAKIQSNRIVFVELINGVRAKHLISDSVNNPMWAKFISSDFNYELRAYIQQTMAGMFDFYCSRGKTNEKKRKKRKITRIWVCVCVRMVYWCSDSLCHNAHVVRIIKCVQVYALRLTIWMAKSPIAHDHN